MKELNVILYNYIICQINVTTRTEASPISAADLGLLQHPRWSALR